MLALKKQSSKIDFEQVDDFIDSRIKNKADNTAITRNTTETSLQYSESSIMRKKGAFKSSSNVAFLETATSNIEHVQHGSLTQRNKSKEKVAKTDLRQTDGSGGRAEMSHQSFE